jgi:predicted ester cyclase
LQGENTVSVEQNKAAIRRLNEEIYDKGNLAIINAHFAPNYVMHVGTTDIKGPEGFRQSQLALKKAFPDYYQKIDRMVGEGDLVVTFLTASGTFKNEYGKMKPTGKQFRANNIILSRYENGKAAEAWVYQDAYAIFQQLGVIAPLQS